MAYIFSNSITASNLGNMKRVGHDKCRKCGIQLKEGDQAWHRTGKNTRWYHEICYKQLRQ